MSPHYFDANTWIGAWPFSLGPQHTAKSLAAHLQVHGIGQALVSPLGAVFQPEPGPANQALLAATRKFSGLTPVPVLNPTMPNWRGELDRCARDPRVAAVRLLPNYHQFRLSSPAVHDLMLELGARKLRVVVNVRLIDERHEYFALNLKGVPTADLDRWLARYPDEPILASGLLRTEVLSLASRHAHLLADLSFAEWHDTVAHLLQQVPGNQLAFASHTPFLVTAAATAKLATTRIPVSVRAKIAGGNLTSFLER